MAKVISGKDLSAQLKDEMKAQVATFPEKYGRVPHLVVILIGEDPGSVSYVTGKAKASEYVGIKNTTIRKPDTITEAELLGLIEELNADESVDGILVQLPLPKHISEDKVIATIAKEKDVDGFRRDSCFDPATPLGIVNYLDYCGFEWTGKEVTIIGRSDIVGKPLARLMTNKDATVTLCHSKSKLSNHIYDSDLIVCAVGKAGFLNCYPIHCPVIDVGINFVDGKLVGDCYNTDGRNVTPVPGGVGLLTRLTLLENVVKAKEMYG